MLKRFVRLSPEYVLCIIMTAYIIGPLFTNLSLENYWQDEAVKFYVRKNLALQPVFYLPEIFSENAYANVVNGSLWSLPVEIITYMVLFACLGLGTKIQTKKKVLGVVSGFVIILAIYCDIRKYSYVYYGTDWITALQYAQYMLVGASFFVFDLYKYTNIRLAIILFIAMEVISHFAGGISKPLCLFTIAYIVFSLVLDETFDLKINGNYSYGIYLYGFVVQQCLVQIFWVERNLPIGVNGMFFVSALMTYVIGRLSHNYCYIPIRKFCESIKLV